ncbi:glycosyltransferase [Desulfoferula mesophila]|uniref:glycosyltransferase n=1 Tax=Desulfoferula mesophila TaxID=3058419 RepID=UPI0030D59294
MGKAGILRLVTLGYGRVIPPRVNRVLPRRLRVLAKYGLNAVSGGPSAPRGPVEYLHTHEHGRHKIKASVRARLARLPECQTSIAAYQQARDQRDPSALKIAVYVTITNNYDSIKLPESFNPGLDYVLFSDRPVADTGVYEVRPITYHNDDPTRTARFVKTHPHVLLGDYDVAVWVDSNIMLLDDIFPLVQKFLVSGKLVASNPHPCRNTLYEEARICRRFKTDDGDLIKNQVKTYRRLQFAHNDLVENNVMMFDLRDERTGRFLDAWWAEMERGSKRDQLSFNYCLASLGLDWHRITDRAAPVLDHPCFALMVHDHAQGPAQELVEALGTGLVDPYAGPGFAGLRDARVRAHSRRAIDIVVCVHDALDDVRRCLDSVAAKRAGDRQKLILIDDGSGPETADYLRGFARGKDWVTLRRNEAARGFSGAVNQGLVLSSGELVIALNSDTVVTDGWAEKMADAVFSTPGAGLVGVMSNAAGYQSLPDRTGTRHQTAINPLPPGMGPDDLNRWCEQWAGADSLPLVPLVHGFCLGFTRQALERVGLLDEEAFPGGYGVEDDYTMRAADAGVLAVLAGHTYVFHAKSKSYAPARRAEFMRRGLRTLGHRHGSHRLVRAMASMAGNPFLGRMRRRAAELYTGDNQARPEAPSRWGR